MSIHRAGRRNQPRDIAAAHAAALPISTGYARYIGRVGALAVALGIGAAVASTPGVALAGPDNADSSAANSPQDSPAGGGRPAAQKTAGGLTKSGGDNDHSNTIDAGEQGRAIDTDDPDEAKSPRWLQSRGYRGAREGRVHVKVGESDPQSGGHAVPGDLDLRDGDETAPDAQNLPVSLPEPPAEPMEVAVMVTPPVFAAAEIAAPTPLAAATDPAPALGADTGGPERHVAAAPVSGSTAAEVPAARNDVEELGMSSLSVQLSDAGAPETFTASTSSRASTISTPQAPAAHLDVPQSSFFDSLLALPGTLIGRVLDLVTSALAPVIGPGAPLDTPSLWGAMLLVRRQFDQSRANHTPTLESGQTSQVLDDGEVHRSFGGDDLDGDTLTYTVADRGDIGGLLHGNAAPTLTVPTGNAASIVPEVQDAPAENSLTYTAGPTIVDQLTVAGLRVLRAVSNAIGVDLFAEFNKLLIANSPPFFLTFGLDARKTEVQLDDGTTWTAWEFQPPHPTDKTVIAIHGSGFIYHPNLMQWYDYASMARDTGATVLVPLYPLATTEAGSAPKIVPELADLISQQIAVHGAENVSVYGDSAGSIIAIAAVEQLVLAGSVVPSRMVLLSLTPDGSQSNPDIKNTNDPVIDVNNLGDYADTHWLDGISPGDPLYNALNFDTLVGLPPTTIYVGSTEFVLPDTLLLYQKAVDEGAPISVVVGQDQIHDWALGGLPINSQAPRVRHDVYEQLGLV
jgi:acetyl esterase/lipase